MRNTETSCRGRGTRTAKAVKKTKQAAGPPALPPQYNMLSTPQAPKWYKVKGVPRSVSVMEVPPYLQRPEPYMAAVVSTTGSGNHLPRQGFGSTPEDALWDVWQQEQHKSKMVSNKNDWTAPSSPDGWKMKTWMASATPLDLPQYGVSPLSLLPAPDSKLLSLNMQAATFTRRKENEYGFVDMNDQIETHDEYYHKYAFHGLTPGKLEYTDGESVPVYGHDPSQELPETGYLLVGYDSYADPYSRSIQEARPLGVFFDEQTALDLANAQHLFEEHEMNERIKHNRASYAHRRMRTEVIQLPVTEQVVPGVSFAEFSDVPEKTGVIWECGEESLQGPDILGELYGN